MSSTLYWKPVTTDGSSLPSELKIILFKRFDMGENVGANGVIIGKESINYLRGLKDADIKGASALIEAIEMHDAVQLWLEY